MGQKKDNALLALAVFTCLVGLAAISSAQTAEPPPAGAQERAPAPAPAEIDVPEALEDESFRYQSAGKRDPFKSLLSLQEKKRDLALLPPIQRVDLKNVTITGVILDEIEGPRAMIKAPNNQTFVVKQGMIIGKNEGEIIEVSLRGIRVVEKFVDFMGQETLKEIFIKTRAKK